MIGVLTMRPVASGSCVIASGRNWFSRKAVTQMGCGRDWMPMRRCKPAMTWGRPLGKGLVQAADEVIIRVEEEFVGQCPARRGRYVIHGAAEIPFVLAHEALALWRRGHGRLLVWRGVRVGRGLARRRCPRWRRSDQARRVGPGLGQRHRQGLEIERLAQDGPWVKARGVVAGVEGVIDDSDPRTSGETLEGSLDAGAITIHQHDVRLFEGVDEMYGARPVALDGQSDKPCVHAAHVKQVEGAGSAHRGRGLGGGHGRSVAVAEWRMNRRLPSTGLARTLPGQATCGSCLSRPGSRRALR